MLETRRGCLAQIGGVGLACQSETTHGCGCASLAVRWQAHRS